ncbi:MAG: hypothetical protein EA383_08320 [Spirochaetaceae bacterium]|nr:MAG: hypothetical protein EA383_08320 [Spirochaetaceae bacterium]
MNASCTQALREENAILLRQLQALLGAITRTDYERAEGPFSRGGIGKHVRHILDHYAALLASEGEVVDYEARRRDTRVETDPAVAADVCEQMIQVLQNTGFQRSEIVVRNVWDAGEGLIATGFERELQFLSSHTVHHMALISFILRYLDIPVPDDFGVAFSTLRYEAASR